MGHELGNCDAAKRRTNCHATPEICPLKFDDRHFSPENFLGQVNSEKSSRSKLEFGEFLMRGPWAWTYEIEKQDGTKATLTLDARIDVEHITRKPDARERVVDWLKRCGTYLGLPEERIKQLRGAVFEARQGYKSADAKRQAADLRFAMNASIENYLPVLSIVSTQASMAVIRRYKNAKMLVIKGVLADDDMISTYAFFGKIVGFELDAFFQRNTDAMRRRCQIVLAALLTPE